MLVLTGLMLDKGGGRAFLGVSQRRPKVVSPEVSVANVQSAIVMQN